MPLIYAASHAIVKHTLADSHNVEYIGYLLQVCLRVYTWSTIKQNPLLLCSSINLTELVLSQENTSQVLKQTYSTSFETLGQKSTKEERVLLLWTVRLGVAVVTLGSIPLIILCIHMIATQVISRNNDTVTKSGQRMAFSSSTPLSDIHMVKP